MASSPYRTPADRLAAHSVYMPDTGCWVWTGATQTNGRPRLAVRVGGRSKWMLCTQYVIRYVREQRATRRTVGMHSCDNPACVAPDHITRGTALRNNRDTVKRGRHANGYTTAQGWAKQTMHCDAVKMGLTRSTTRTTT